MFRPSAKARSFSEMTYHFRIGAPRLISPRGPRSQRGTMRRALRRSIIAMMTDHKRVLVRRIRSAKSGSPTVRARKRDERMERPLFPALRLEELNIHIAAVDANEYAAAVGKTGGRQQLKKFLEVETLDRAPDREQRIRIGDGPEQAISAPGFINAHDADITAARPNVTRSSPFSCSAMIESSSGRGPGRDGFPGRKRTPSPLQPLGGRAQTAR